MTVVHSYKGKFLHTNVDAVMDAAIGRLLRRVGRITADEMKSYTKPHDFDGTLTESITWRTGTDRGTINSEENLISAPDEMYAVDVGSALSYAFYREFGAGPHQSSENGAEFIAKLKRWMRDKMGKDPDGKDYALFQYLVKKIQAGQDAVPFATPSIPAMIKEARAESRNASFKKAMR